MALVLVLYDVGPGLHMWTLSIMVVEDGAQGRKSQK
jgi:hypothetical protein